MGSQKLLGGAEQSQGWEQEEPGGIRRSQEKLGESQENEEEPGGAKRSQGDPREPRGAKKRQESQEGLWGRPQAQRVWIRVFLASQTIWESRGVKQSLESSGFLGFPTKLPFLASQKVWEGKGSRESQGGQGSQIRLAGFN